MVEICNLTRRKTPRLPYEEIARAVLPKEYELSLVFCGPTLSHRLNKEKRGKDTSTNVLSFPLTEMAGEIFIDMSIAVSEAKRDDVTLTQRVGILFIHGLHHLAGLDHGRTMEEAEEKIARNFL